GSVGGLRGIDRIARHAGDALDEGAERELLGGRNTVCLRTQPFFPASVRQKERGDLRQEGGGHAALADARREEQIRGVGQVRVGQEGRAERTADREEETRGRRGGLLLSRCAAGEEEQGGGQQERFSLPAKPGPGLCVKRAATAGCPS